MRVFVAGATGAIGSRLVALLAMSGHSVFGLTRTPAKAEQIRRAGGEPVIGDALDALAMRAAVRKAQPDVVIHELTALTNAIDLTHFAATFAQTNRLRTAGTDNLLAAAIEAGARRFVAQSFCGWPFARKGGPVKSEDDPLDDDPPRQMRDALAAIRHVENRVARGTGYEGVVLRYGGFYGPDTGLCSREFIAELRRRRVPVIGGGAGWWSFLHVDDAAAATAQAIERWKPGIYNIVDDDPAPVNVWLPAIAEMLGAPPPRRIPAWLARIIAGAPLVALMTQARAGTNAKAKSELGWQPAHPSWRRGVAEILAAEG